MYWQQVIRQNQNEREYTFKSEIVFGMFVYIWLQNFRLKTVFQYPDSLLSTTCCHLSIKEPCCTFHFPPRNCLAWKLRLAHPTFIGSITRESTTCGSPEIRKTSLPFSNRVNFEFYIFLPRPPIFGDGSAISSSAPLCFRSDLKPQIYALAFPRLGLS